MAALIDTNVLVYCHDGRFPAKQRIALELLGQGVPGVTIHVAHQAILEFVAVVTRTRSGARALLTPAQAWGEVEALLTAFPVLYPNDEVVHRALWGAATYQMAWYDAHMWAYAEYYSLEELLSEDFQDGRVYGSVRIRNPFAGLTGTSGRASEARGNRAPPRTRRTRRS